MLTVEILKQQTALSGLTDEQLTAIAELSKNDEARVIGPRIAEVHNQYDKDIKAITGLDKPDGVKTYDHLKTILQGNVDKIAELSNAAGKVKGLEGEISTLKEQLKKGGGDATAAQITKLEQDLADERNRVATLKSQVKAAEDERDNLKSSTAARLQRVEVESAWSQDLAKATPKAGITPELFAELVQIRKENFFQNTTIEEDETTNGKTFRFRREGKLLEDASNGLRPFTAKDILQREILAGLVSENGGGGGAGGSGGGSGGGSTLAGGWKTQVEADDAIRQHLIDKGVGVTHPEHDAQHQKIRGEHKVTELPIS